MSEPRRKVTLTAAVASALRRSAIGELVGYQQHANGDITFELSDDVAEELDRDRKPGETDADVICRRLEENTGITLRSKPS